MEPTQIYLTLMDGVRRRFDLVDAIQATNADAFSKAEVTAFQCRKIIEAVAFGCLVAMHNGLKIIPNDTQGQWNVEVILKKMRKRHPDMFPGPNRVRAATAAEQAERGAKLVYEGVPDRRLRHDDLIDMYKRMHRWLHEINPYTGQNREKVLREHGAELQRDVERLYRLLEVHIIAIGGEAIIAFLRHPTPDQSYVGSASQLRL